MIPTTRASPAMSAWRAWPSITLNPAFLLKQPQAKKAAWADLLTVAARLDDIQPASDSKPPQISS